MRLVKCWIGFVLIVAACPIIFAIAPFMIAYDCWFKNVWPWELF